MENHYSEREIKRKRTNVRIDKYKNVEQFIKLIFAGDIRHDELFWDLLNNVDNALLEIDFDIMACTARSICWHVKNSFINIQENRGRKIDKFIVGFSG